MKRIVLFVNVIMLCANVHGQIILQPHPINEWLITPVNLLQTDIVNQGESVNGRVITELKGSNNDVILTVSSSMFRINNGFNRYTPVQAARYSYSNSGLSTYLRNYNYLPAGTYQVCYTLAIESGSEVPSVFCTELQANTLQSLFLIMPFDGEEIESKNPLLSWNVMSTPTNLEDGSHYELKLALWPRKVSRERALEGMPMIHLQDLKSFQVPYTSDLPELKYGERYVWQVRKINNGKVVDKTEVWSFSLNDDLPSIPTYVNLSREPNSYVYETREKKVYVRFNESYSGDNTPKIRIRTEKTEGKNVNTSNTTRDMPEPDFKHEGFNQFVIDLTSLHLKKGIYEMEIIDEKEFKYYLKFKI